MYILRVSLKNSFVYRSSTIFNIFGSIIQIFICIALWKYIYKENMNQMNYMVMYTILSNIIGLFYANELGQEISGKIVDGSFAMELIKPVNFIYLGYMKMLGKIIANIITRGLPIIIIFLPLTISNLDRIYYRQIPLALLMVIIGHVLYCLMFTLVSFIAFVCFEVWPFNRMLSDTIRFLSGSFIPIALFPVKIQKYIEFLPFNYLYAFPLKLILNKTDGDELMGNLIILVLWLIVLFGLLRYIYNRAINRLVIQGG